MTPREAAAELGYTTSSLRTLIRNGEINATKVPSTANRHGYVYKISKTEVNRFKRLPVSGKGERGQPRPDRRKV